MSMRSGLRRRFCDVDDALACSGELYDVVLDLRDLADKNPALDKILRRFSEKIDDISRELLRGSEVLEDLMNMVEARLDDEDDAAIVAKANAGT